MDTFLSLAVSHIAALQHQRQKHETYIVRLINALAVENLFFFRRISLAVASEFD